MDTTILGLLTVLVALFIVSPNILRYLDLQLTALPTRIASLWFKLIIGMRLWFDRFSFRAFRSGPVGHFLREQQLKAIMRNPAYKQFFDHE